MFFQTKATLRLWDTLRFAILTEGTIANKVGKTFKRVGTGTDVALYIIPKALERACAHGVIDALTNNIVKPFEILRGTWRYVGKVLYVAAKFIY